MDSKRHRRDLSPAHLLTRAHTLIEQCQLSGNLCFDGHAPTPQELQVAADCRTLSDDIHDALPHTVPGDLPSLLEWYDPIHRLGYGNAPDNDFVIRQRRRAIDAWTAGDPSISETAIYEMIAREMTNTAATIDADELRLYLTLKKKRAAVPAP